MDIVSDTYIHGGIPQSRYCSNCAHYQTLSGSSIDSNCGRAVLRQKHSHSRPRKRRAAP